MPSHPSDHGADARAAREVLERLLEADAPSLRSSLPNGFADAIERYVALLLDRNAALNLTRLVAPDDVARQHLLDALSALPILDAAAPHRAVDLGSGGGVPGIVLALARPGIAWTLVDSVRKKADALREFVDALGMASTTVEAARAEALGRTPGERAAYDVVTARAVAPLAVLVEYALPLLRPGGVLVAWKGPASEAELAAAARAVEMLGGDPPLVRPTGIAALGEHRLVTVTKVGPTPDRYPRRPGEPSRRPLG